MVEVPGSSLSPDTCLFQPFCNMSERSGADLLIQELFYAFSHMCNLNQGNCRTKLGFAHEVSGCNVWSLGDPDCK
jgi:hypothetical protein